MDKLDAKDKAKAEAFIYSIELHHKLGIMDDCFNDCVKDFDERRMTEDEKSCLRNCAVRSELCQ